MDNSNQPVENQTENQNPPKSFGSQFLAVINAKWFLVGVVLVACVGLYAISASSRGLWPFPALEEKVALIPTPSPTFTPLPDPTASWQTYRNEEYGFELKLPPDWTIENLNSEKRIYFTSLEKRKATEENQKNCSGAGDGTKCIPEWLLGDIVFSNINNLDSANPSTVKDKVINGVKFRSYFTQDLSNSTNYYTTSNGKNYNFELYFDNPIKSQILSTFKFIPLTSSGPVPSIPFGTGEPGACIQVITPARNPQTGEVKDFPTPCDVPAGWEVLQ